MKLKQLSEVELELLSHTDMAELILEENKNTMSTADVFKKICELLKYSEEEYTNKIGDFYTSMTTDKRFIMLEDGSWDLRSRHTSDKVIKIADEEDEEEDEEEKEEIEEEIEEDSYDDTEAEEYDEDTNEELKDLVVIDEDELELEQ